MSESKPYHRRTLDESCETCSAPPGIECTDQRRGEPVPTKNLHRYQP